MTDKEYAQLNLGKRVAGAKAHFEEAGFTPTLVQFSREDGQVFQESVGEFYQPIEGEPAQYLGLHVSPVAASDGMTRVYAELEVPPYE